jgi:hypothetical protein
LDFLKKSLSGENLPPEKKPAALEYLRNISKWVTGYLLKKSSKKDDWIKRWFVLNERTNRVSQHKLVLHFNCKKIHKLC